MVRISVGSPTHHTSGRLYGVFFEDIHFVDTLLPLSYRIPRPEELY